MRKKKQSVKNLPLSSEEWKDIKKYQRLPFHEKLALIDRMRSFQYEIWKCNPSIYRQHEKFRRGEI